MTEVADLYVVLRAVGGKFEEGMARAGASAEAADAKMAGLGRSVKMMSLALAGAGLLVAGEALKMSSEFDRSMEQLHTLAHVPQKEIKALGDGVLALAGQVGFSPGSLAEAMYHVESSFASMGISGKKALDLLKVGAEGAQIGHANLVDVVNALDAAIASGVPGVQNMNSAMGALLATVGAGDMTMQNLADAMGTGIMVVAKQYGATLPDIGAGLATLGDNLIRGSKAGTELRMAIQDLALQSPKSASFLKDNLGLAVGQLTKDLQTGGLKKALEDLHNHLDAAGIKGNKVGAVLGEAFTKKSSAPLAILVGQLGRFESKFPELQKGMGTFGDAWKHTASLMAVRAQMAKANVEAAFIGLGHILQPIAGQVLNAFNKAFEWVKHHKEVMKELIAILKPVLVGALVLVGIVLAEMAVSAAIAAAPFILLAAAIGLAVKWFMHLYEHNAKVREFVATVVAGFKRDAVIAVKWLIGAFQEAKKIIGEVIDAIIGFYEHHKKAINGMIKDVAKVLEDLWKVFKAAFDVVVAVVKTAVKIVEDLWDRFGSHIWAHVVTAWNAIVQVIRGALQYVKGIFEMITGILTGNWSKFWKGVQDTVGGAWKIIVGVVKTAINLLSTAIGAGMAAISALWGLVWHTIETVAKNVWKGIKNVGKSVLDWFAGLVGKIVHAFAGAGSWLLQAGYNIVTGLLRGIGRNVVALFKWAANLPGELFHALDSLYTNMLIVGQNLVTGIWNGITKMAKWLYDQVKNFCESIWNGIKDFFGIGSPSRLMADTVGKHLMTGIAAGIVENQHHVHNALKKVADDAGKTQINMRGFAYGKYLSQANSSAGHGMVGSGNTVYNITVQGQVIDTAGLFKAMQTATQQHGSRNRSNGLVFTR